jgi:polyisoprenyl-phosphate glycosyltransferase
MYTPLGHVSGSNSPRLWRQEYFMAGEAAANLSAPLLSGGPARPDLSIVIPLFNEEEVLPALHAQLQEQLRTLGVTYELLLVNDGSRDNSELILRQLRQSDSHLVAIHFSRNFGHQAAVTAGLARARGKAVVVMDADLQDPPAVLSALVARWRDGFHIVYAKRKRRRAESLVKRGLAFAYYRLLRILTDVEIPVDVGDFCLMDRRVVDALNSLPERNRYLRGLRAWLGFRQTAIEFDRPPRAAGAPKYTVRKSFALAVNGVVGFSKVPLRFASYLGLVIAAFSFALGAWFVILNLRGVDLVRGWTSTIVAVTFLGGVQLIAVGILGEYLSRVYDEVRQRPMYVIRDMDGAE